MSNLDYDKNYVHRQKNKQWIEIWIGAKMVDETFYKTELHGREEIFTDVKVIDKSNIADVLNKAFITHEKNRSEMSYLIGYEKGIQPILSRKKYVRPEINEKCVENHAYEITSFKIGYEFGSPVTFVQRGNREMKNCNPEQDDLRVSALNEMMFEENKPSKDIQLARNFKICGVGYRFIYPKKNQLGVSPFDILIPNPLNTFIIKSNDAYRETLVGVMYSERVDDRTKIIGAYTKDWYFEFPEGLSGQIKSSANILGKVPIIEYVNGYDRMGCFEKVIPLIDALNVATSDRVNDLAQHVQNLLWGDNIDIDKEKYGELREDGMILTNSSDGRQSKLQYLESVLDQQETQTLVDYLYDQILQIAGVPGRKTASGGNTGNAIMLSNGWDAAETSAKSMELTFGESERQMLDVVLEIIKNTPDIQDELKYLCASDVAVKFSRNRTYDLVSRVNSMATMVNMGIDPLKAISVVDIFDDPQQVTVDSKDRIDKVLFSEKKNTDASENQTDNAAFEDKTEESVQPDKVSTING